MLLTECQPLEWYLVVTCPDCKTRQAIFRDPSQGNATIRRTYKHKCEGCGVEKFYEPEEIERYRHII